VLVDIWFAERSLLDGAGLACVRSNPCHCSFVGLFQLMHFFMLSLGLYESRKDRVPFFIPSLASIVENDTSSNLIGSKKGKKIHSI
jgi:hypothetical protein